MGARLSSTPRGCSSYGGMYDRLVSSRASSGRRPSGCIRHQCIRPLNLAEVILMTDIQAKGSRPRSRWLLHTLSLELAQIFSCKTSRGNPACLIRRVLHWRKLTKWRLPKGLNVQLLMVPSNQSRPRSKGLVKGIFGKEQSSFATNQEPWDFLPIEDADLYVSAFAFKFASWPAHAFPSTVPFVFLILIPLAESISPCACACDGSLIHPYMVF